MKSISVSVIALFLFLFSTKTALAIPSLIPFIPLIGIAIFKIVMAMGTIFFLVLSIFKKQKKVFLAVGVIAFFILIGVLIIY